MQTSGQHKPGDNPRTERLAHEEEANGCPSAAGEAPAHRPWLPPSQITSTKPRQTERTAARQFDFREPKQNASAH